MQKTKLEELMRKEKIQNKSNGYLCRKEAISPDWIARRSN